MRASLTFFQEGIEDLRKFINGIEKSSNLLKTEYRKDPPIQEYLFRLEDFQKHFRAFHIKQTIYNYKTVIISLYGLLESFVENLIKSYLEFLSETVSSYGELPESILKNHFNKSADLIQKIDTLPKYQNLKKEDVIKNLNKCIETPENYALNIDAYTYHTANFKHDVIVNFFKQVGIEISNYIREEKPFKNYLSEEYPEIDIPEHLNVYEKLNDLANRRNDVAHGAEINLLGPQDLLDYISYVEAYCLSLYNVVYNEALTIEINYNAIELNNPKLIVNNEIICLELNNTSISIGDKIVASSERRPYYYSEILGIQVNRVEHQTIEAQESIDVGIKVGFKAKQNQKFFLLKS
ncbi:MAE_28990/MAE_18760 family HEPN-like nuclease [Lysinibacillus capsici]|uniref:MAE_28990/MAE_18760 family HEPN-like nuclease n=1 Tax=Lysinibacillus capsici TaxID=2115968 RepID=UPI0028AECC8A|nr:MAE_28990/MAE_18760 family HEPN-like nuclease [Lysinibacillus capsici]